MTSSPKRSVILVHGIKSNGYGSIFNLAPALRSAGLSVRCFQYPHNRFIDTFSKRKSRENAQLLLDFMSEGDDVIFHSNGARVVHAAMVLGAQFRQAYAFAPAFGARVRWPRTGFKKMNVIFNPRDWALWVGSIIPHHAFGLLGAYGYQGEYDERIHGISNLVKHSMDTHNHSQMWKDQTRLGHWAEYLIQRLKT